MARAKRLTKTVAAPALVGTPITRAVAEFTERDRERLVAAERARREGKTLTASQAKLLARYETKMAEQERLGLLRSIPRKLVGTLAGYSDGRPLDDWVEQYGAPVGKRAVDLALLLVWIRNDLADRSARNGQLDPAADDLLGGSSPALEKYREQRARLAELDVLEREQNLLPRDDVRALLHRVGSVLRQACDTLQHQFGPEARDVIADALTEVEAIVAQEMPP